LGVLFLCYFKIYSLKSAHGYYKAFSIVLNFRAESIYEEMKQKYGTQGCYLLKINSRTSNRASDEQIPDPWSQYLQKNSIQNQVYVKNNNEANHESCIVVL
jgi:hypothetical protein